MARLSYPVSAAEVGESLAGGGGEVVGQVFLREQLAIGDLGGRLVLGRDEALRGRQQRLAPRRGGRRDVGGRQVVLRGRRRLTLTRVRVADAAGGLGHGAGVVALEQRLQHAARLAPLLVLDQEP